MIGDIEDEWTCRQLLVSGFFAFIFSICFMSFGSGYFFGCNLVTVALFFNWVLGSILIISKYWNKECLLDYWGWTWITLLSTGRNEGDCTWLILSIWWDSLNGYESCYKERVDQWYIKLVGSKPIQMFHLVSLNQVHQGNQGTRELRHVCKLSQRQRFNFFMEPGGLH